MNGKSASVQNFKNLIEQMIDGALENNDQMVQFHRMIYKKWYLKQLSESKSTECKQNEMKLSEPNNKQNSSATVAHRRSLWDIEAAYAKKHSKAEQIQSFVSTNDKRSTVIDNKNDFNQLNDIRFFPIVSGDTEVIKIWSSPMKRTDALQNTKQDVPKKARSTLDHSDGLPNRQQNGEKLSFEAWKKKKTIAYRRIIKKIENEQQQKLLKNLVNKEWKKIIQHTQVREKQQYKFRQNQRLLSKKRLETIKPIDMMLKRNCNKINEKRIIGEDILNTGKQKETKLDNEQRSTSMMTTRTSNNASNDRKDRTISMVNHIQNVAFRSWLNQLNRILHKKYLREHRHLVQSFYCQPFYYGSTVYCTR